MSEFHTEPPIAANAAPTDASDAAEVPDPPETTEEVGGDAESSGHTEVDRVLGSLQQIDELPVSEHVAIFETAHERLRGALADAGNEPGGS